MRRQLPNSFAPAHLGTAARSLSRVRRSKAAGRGLKLLPAQSCLFDNVFLQAGNYIGRHPVKGWCTESIPGEHAAMPTYDHIQKVEPVKWDSKEKQFLVTLYGIMEDPNEKIAIKYSPSVLYEVRIREASSESFSPAFVTPLSSVSFQGTRPDVDYEVTMQPIDSATGKPIANAKPQRTIITAGEKIKLG